MQLIIPFRNEGFSCIEAILAWRNTLCDSTNENMKHSQVMRSCIQKQLHRMQYKGMEHKDLKRIFLLFFFFNAALKTCTMSEKDQTIV